MADTNSTILLTRFEYCHTKDNNTGTLILHEGPCRLQLESHQVIVGSWNKVRVFDGQFAIVSNPWNADRDDILEGEREVRVGPCVFPLYPGERLEDPGVSNEYVLTDSDALLLHAEKEAPDPVNKSGVLSAGTELLLKGPCRYIPHKNIRIKEKRQSISLAEAQGVYVQDDDTGVVRLVKGPTDFFLEHNESLWEKHLTPEEEEGLGYTNGDDDLDADSRSLSSAPREREADEAIVVELEANEAIYLYDSTAVRVEFGPKTIFLGPNERPKVLHISGGVPIKPKVLRITKLALGPDFIRDRLRVRTRDNANLLLDVTYHWRFVPDTESPQRLFALRDFVGYTAQTLSSEVREAAAKHDFEHFHSAAAEIVKLAIFKAGTRREFEENSLEVFSVDVESITPDDPEIQRKLSDAIKTNVDIYTRRVKEEAELDSERRLIDGRRKNEEARRTLIEFELGNAGFKQLELAKSECEALLVSAHGEAEALTVRAQAERTAEKERLAIIVEVLSGAGGERYLELERARALKATDKIVVPTDARLYLGVDRLIDNKV